MAAIILFVVPAYGKNLIVFRNLQRLTTTAFKKTLSFELALHAKPDGSGYTFCCTTARKQTSQVFETYGVSGAVATTKR